MSDEKIARLEQEVVNLSASQQRIQEMLTAMSAKLDRINLPRNGEQSESSSANSRAT